jgi:hypothetical protein
MGIIGSKPAAVAQANGQIDVFWRGSSDNHLWHAQYRRGKGWSRPQNLGGHLASAPAPAVSGHGALTVAWRGTNGHLWVIRRSGQSWGKPVDRGMGKLGSAPAVTGLASGLVDVFWAATSHKGVWHATYTPGSGWSKATELSGGLSAGPVAVSAPGKGADVFWKGTDGKLWWSASQGSSWQRAAPLGNGAAGQRAIRCWPAQWRDRRVLERRQQSPLARPVQRGHLGRPGQPGRCGQLRVQPAITHQIGWRRGRMC